MQEQTYHFYDKSENATDYSWIFGDGDSSVLKNPFHFFPDIFLYKVKLISGNSCFKDSIYYNILVLPYQTDSNRLNMPVNSSTVRSCIFPNPAGNYLYVVLNNEDLDNPNKLFVEIYDEAGRLEKSEKFENTMFMKLDTKELKNGIHFLVILNNKKIFDKQKFIKQ